MGVNIVNSISDPQLCIDLKRWGIISPSSIVFIGDFIYIAGQYSHKIYALNKNTMVLDVIADNLNYPTDICVDDENKLWVTDRWNHSVKRFSTKGELMLSFGEYGNSAGKFSEPWGIGYHNGFIVVSDRNNHRIQIFDKNGSYIRTFGVQGPAKEYYETTEFKKGFIFENWTQFASRFFTVDSQFFKENYKIGSMEYPLNFDISSQGDIIIVDSSNDRFQLFSFEGQLKRSYCAKQSGIPFELAVDASFVSQNQFFVSYEFADSVFAMDMDGKITASIKIDEARLNFVYCIDGAIWILDSWNSKLYKFLWK